MSIKIINLLPIIIHLPDLNYYNYLNQPLMSNK